MHRTHEYRGYSISVSVEANFSWSSTGTHGGRVEYVSVIDIVHPVSRKPLTSRLRLGDVAGNAFASEADALLGGCSAARRIIDDLFTTADELGDSPRRVSVNVVSINK